MPRTHVPTGGRVPRGRGRWVEPAGNPLQRRRLGQRRTDHPAGSMRVLIQDSLAQCLHQRPGEDLVALCLRKPESEAADALRTAPNASGRRAGHLARRVAHLRVARTELTIQDLPSSHPLASVEAKAMTAVDALSAGFESWFTPHVLPDVAKLRRASAGERLSEYDPPTPRGGRVPERSGRDLQLPHPGRSS